MYDLYTMHLIGCDKKEGMIDMITRWSVEVDNVIRIMPKGWLDIAKLKPLSLFISQLSMLKKAFYNVRIEK